MANPDPRREARKALEQEAGKWGISIPRFVEVAWIDVPELGNKLPESDEERRLLRLKNSATPPKWEQSGETVMLLLDTHGFVRSRESYRLCHSPPARLTLVCA